MTLHLAPLPENAVNTNIVRHAALAGIVVVATSACGEAEQDEFLDAAEQVGGQVAEQMDRLGQRMDALLGQTDADFGELSARLREIDLPALRANLEPQLEKARADLDEVRRKVEAGAELTPGQRERLQEVNTEIEILAREAREALGSSEGRLRELGDRLADGVASLEADLDALQRDIEVEGGRRP